MFDHILVDVDDLARSKAFHKATLTPLGISLQEFADSMAGFGTAAPGFWIAARGQAKSHVHLAFPAPSREAVDSFHAAAVEAGGTDNGAPGLRPDYGDGYYAAFVLDPDGNNIEAVSKDA
jgi:catechol 2,3-dioxygenase-like lactoylglutathione lyase family enzyme